MRILFFCLLNLSFTIYSTTFVYNIKLRRSFEIESEQKNIQKKWEFTFTPCIEGKTALYNDQRSMVDETRLYGGTLIDIRYNPLPSVWLELTTGVAKERLYARTTTQTCYAARTGFDDIVLELGYNYLLCKEMQLNPYVLIGLPTRLKLIPLEVNEALVGTRVFNAGIGLEFSQTLWSKDNQQFLMFLQTRFIHAFNRSFFPVFPQGTILKPGNYTDLLLSFQYRNKHDVLEFGFNPELYSNIKIQSPTICIKIPLLTRLFPYINYEHMFKRSPTARCDLAIDIGYSYGSQKIYDTQVQEAWLNFTIGF